MTSIVSLLIRTCVSLLIELLYDSKNQKKVDNFLMRTRIHQIKNIKYKNYLLSFELQRLKTMGGVSEKEFNAAQEEIYDMKRQLNEAQKKQSEVKTLRSQFQQAQQRLSRLTTQNSVANKRLETLTAEYNVTKQDMKSLKDPKKIKENQQKLFLSFLQILPNFSIYNPIPKVDGLKYAAVIGETSAGKSSIYNWIFGLNLETGQGEVTLDIQRIFTDVAANRAYFDAPGLNEEIEIIDADVLHAFYQIDQVFVVTDRTFKFSKKCLQVMNKINPPQLCLVRTKCDLFKSDAELQKVMKQDRDYISSLQINREILYISSHLPDTFRDNLKFKRLMSGELI